MESTIQYIIKFSISIAVLYLFYRIVLRPLTFYQWNRWYLLGYCLLSFVIPFVDVRPWFDFSDQKTGSIINAVPSISAYPLTLDKSPASAGMFSNFGALEWGLLTIAAGSFFLLIRLAIQYCSLMSIRRRAVLVSKGSDVDLYEIDLPAGPFSFGKAIYVNSSMHNAEELERIIQHEYVHVRQRHSFDLMIAELLCIVNWFNPFAWMVRYAVRQNLEFIADNKVVQNGIDLKEYQYLLLKVVGIPQYRIANHFNLSNLKKRIAMMNKMQTAKMHLTKFLFVLPVLVLVLLAFRSSEAQEPVKPPPMIESAAAPVPPPAIAPTKKKPEAPPVVMRLTPSTVAPAMPTSPAAPVLPAAPKNDTNPAVKEVVVVGYATRKADNANATVNSKGYILTVADNGGECVVIVKNKNKKILKAVALVDWNNNPDYEQQYGKIPPPPPPARPKTSVTLKGVSAPSDNVLYVVDGVEQPKGNAVLQKLDPNTIKEVRVLKDGAAIDKYGEKARDGVVEVVTKSSEDVTIIASKITLSGKSDSLNRVLFFVDGKKMGYGSDSIRDLDPDQIGSLNVLKSASALATYGEEGRNGVILITTKKK